MEDKFKIPPEKALLPRHIGIIMDGNGRWAKKRGLPRKMGHKVGAETFEKTVRCCQEFGIEYLTVYAFSTENWKRPTEEVNAIMELFGDYLSRAWKNEDKRIKINFIGDRNRLSKDLIAQIEKTEKGSETNVGLCLNIALNYGGREEITNACKELARKCVNGELKPEEINENSISDSLYTGGQPDPDLILRPSGEKRISNFLLWQSAYSEYVFMDVLWPDFGREEFLAALWEYSKRSRRFGGV